MSVISLSEYRQKKQADSGKERAPDTDAVPRDERHEVYNFNVNLGSVPSRTALTSQVVSLSIFRAKKNCDKAKVGKKTGDMKLLTHAGFTPDAADSISLEEGYEIAQSIIGKYSEKGSLLAAFLRRQKRATSETKKQELHEVLLRQRRQIALFSTNDLKALLALYKKNPEFYYETYILPAAEEYTRRFDLESQEEA